MDLQRLLPACHTYVMAIILFTLFLSKGLNYMCKSLLESVRASVETWVIGICDYNHSVNYSQDNHFLEQMLLQC